MNEIKAIVHCCYFPFTATTNLSPLTLQEVRDDPLLMTSMTESLCNPGLMSAKKFRPLSSLARERAVAPLYIVQLGWINCIKDVTLLPPQKQNKKTISDM